LETQAAQIPGRLFPHHDNQSIYLLLHLILNHPISNPDLRKHILRFRRILLQFPSNMCHIYAQNTVIIVRIGTPDIRNNRIIRHDSAGILRQQGDNLKLDLRQMDIPSINRYQMFFKIDRQSLCMEWALIKRRSCV
jgi:hypothetical protein